jgi:hypothetical protein
MPISFACEKCGRQFQVDEISGGKRGRCSQCGHIMRIPKSTEADTAEVHQEAPTGPAPAAEEPPFRLSPLEPRPIVRPLPQALDPVPEAGARQPADTHRSMTPNPETPSRPAHTDGHDVKFELLDDDVDPSSLLPLSPGIARGLRELADFEKDRRGYEIVGERAGFFSRLERSRPASWIYVKWRACVGLVLKLLRWVDSWAYLISVPFVMLMIFGIVVANRGLVHIGAVVIVLSNYGRFWADLIAFFVRPYKDGPLQGLAFLFPPYTVYYLVAHWDRMKPIVRRIATSCIPIVLVILAYAFLPSVNPAAKDVQGVGAKIRAGEQELVREIDHDLSKVQRELESLKRQSKLSPSRSSKSKRQTP